MQTLNAEFEKPKISSDSDIFSGITLRKNVKQRDKELETLINPDLLSLQNVTFQKYDKKIFKRGLEKDEIPFPVNARIGPYEVINPIEGSKNYYWWAWGMSRKQPFCDGSHFGTKFRPIKFRIEQKAHSIQLCGWKLSMLTPFCDGKTCVAIKNRALGREEQNVEQPQIEEQSQIEEQTKQSLE